MVAFEKTAFNHRDLPRPAAAHVDLGLSPQVVPARAQQ